MPFAKGDPFLIGADGCEDFVQSILPSLGKMNSAGHCVKHPAEDCFDGGPGGVAFEQLVERDGIVP